jgi:N-acetylneuraminic acid mutarotase
MDKMAFDRRLRLSRWLAALLVMILLGFERLALAQAFVPVAPLATARAEHTATVLQNGQLLAAGGYSTLSGLPTSSAELYNSTTNSWSSGGSLSTARFLHTATLLQSGRVLVAAGATQTGGQTSVLKTSELYDPTADAWSSGGPLATARYAYTATLLQSGQVLAVGGTLNATTQLSSAELYNPTTNSWSSGGSLANARTSHTATLLQNGQVLVAGGFGLTGELSSVEVYNPTTNTWSAAGSLADARQVHTATLLQSGQVLVVGGFGLSSILSSAELYNPTTNTWSAAGSLAVAREGHTATLLKNGQVLVAGGITEVDGGSTLASTVELYDPVTNTWSSTGSLVTPRYQHTETLLGSGQVLVAGGVGGPNLGAVLSSAELFTSALLAPPAPALPMWATLLLATGLLPAAAAGLRKRKPAATARSISGSM